MTSVDTIHQGLADDGILAGLTTGDFKEDFERAAPLLEARLRRPAAIGWAFESSSTDVLEDRTMDVVTVQTQRPIRRRRISLAEACAIALEGLLLAEERRRQFAEEEARWSLFWEDEDEE